MGSRNMAMHRLRLGSGFVFRRALHTYWRFSRGMTLGVRAVVVNAANEVFLVEHSYVAGWHLPGGGVEPGETILHGLARELDEEANVALTAAPTLYGLYFNNAVSRRDHVALFVVRDFRQESAPSPGREIVGHGFFALDVLPADTTGGTRRRLAEVFEGVAISEWW